MTIYTYTHMDQESQQQWKEWENLPQRKKKPTPILVLKNDNIYMDQESQQQSTFFSQKESQQQWKEREKVKNKNIGRKWVITHKKQTI